MMYQTTPFSVSAGLLATLATALPLYPVMAGDAQFTGAVPYTAPADSPYASVDFGYFHLEDFEGATITATGATLSAGWVLADDPDFLGDVDSVDADDGTVDGANTGQAGQSLFSNGEGSLTVTFDAGELGGQLPTHAGIVWTDGGLPLPDGGAPTGPMAVRFSATDGQGNSLGSSGPFQLGDTEVTGQTAEDRFLGVQSPFGIGSITITMPDTDNWEVDHLQYGFERGTNTLDRIFSDHFELTVR